MSTKSSLTILLDLAQQKTDVLAKKLGKLNNQQQEAEKKLNLLLQYRHSYQTYMQDSTKTGLDHIEWLNFIAFMNKLEAAITEQRQAVLFAQNKKIAGSDEFLSSQQKLKSYETLSQRKKNVENLIQAKNEQKTQDEFTSNSYYRNSYPPKNG